ncbi:hypothetical protein ACJMK2_018793 [Sinanodonta woodiana]|uniref:THD domain-containing protein n=1 Tax=Sinanodonta woodiana TaxID=1069815 RepID=A0ABD3UFY6_SINWO
MKNLSLMSTVEKSCNTLSEKCLATLLVILFVLFVLVLSVITVFRFHTQGNSLKTEPQLCIACHELALFPDEDIEGFSRFSIRRNGTLVLCCLRALGDISEIVALMVERKRRYTISKGIVKDLPITCGVDDRNKGNAKLVGVLSSIRNKSDGYLTKIQWDINSAASFVGSAITFVNGSFRVLESGFYYLYSSLVYSQEYSNVTDELKMFRHVFYRHLPRTETKYDVIMMENCNSLCMPYSSRGRCVGSSRMESIFYLRREEEVYIKVSDPERLSKNERDNYFGLFSI